MTRFLILLISLISCVNMSGQQLVRQSKELKLMGTRFVITATAVNETTAWKGINAAIEEISRIEKLISSWDPNSETSAINRSAGINPMVVSTELFSLIERSKKISELTSGAFDISFASMGHLYTFDKKERPLPEDQLIEDIRSSVDWNKIVLNPESKKVFLEDEGMKIGFGAIGKGYAANMAQKVMREIEGVKGGIINASGDLSIWGMVSNAEASWTIKIADPKDIDRAMATIEVENTSVVTSGNYEQYFTSQGKRFSHIIDPKSGYPTTGIKSVTIVCKDAEIGDALATATFVLGVKDGLYMINKLKGVEAIIVTDEDQLLTTDNIHLNYIK
ncbi:MAG: FAD:protein FMN transferase [Saprospiraceae bacterium]|nr:FAD:protein FMN transferase [Saprospiraceae bacterium]